MKTAPHDSSYFDMAGINIYLAIYRYQKSMSFWTVAKFYSSYTRKFNDWLNPPCLGVKKYLEVSNEQNSLRLYWNSF